MNILKRPMFYATLICSAAAAISLYIRALTFLIISFGIILLTIVILHKKYKYITVVLSVILFTVSLIFQFIQIDNINKYNHQTLSEKFLVIKEPEKYDNFNIITLKAIQNNTLPKNTKYLAFDYKKTKLKMGDIVKADIKLSVIDRYDEYRLYDYGNGAYAKAEVKKIERTDYINVFYKTAGSIRDYVKNTVTTHFKDDTAGLLLALTTGDKSLLSDDFFLNIKTTGISHIIVVSGLHLSIIMSAVFWCLDGLFYNKYVRSLLSTAFVILIFAVCGFTMSITRAGAMFIIAGLAPVFNRDNDSLSSLLTAVTAVLIGAPFAIVNISFQLSVLSTLAIIWVVPFYYGVIVERFNISSKILKAITSVFLCSVFAIIFTLPVTIKTFGFVSVVSPLTNLLITYPVTIALVANIVALLFYGLPIIKLLSYALFFVLGLCVKFAVITVNAIAKLPITVAVLPKSAFWWSIMLIVAVIGYMYFYQYKKRKDVI